MGFVFHCLRCGECCRSLMARKWSGLTLFPWEKHLFTGSKVYPYLGYGKSLKSPKFRVFLYRYIDPVCEKLMDDVCSIQEQKPLVCRSYPFRYTKVGTDRVIYEAAPECRSIRATKPGGTWAKFPELYSSEEIGYHLTQFYAMKERKWRYDHLSEAWTPYSRE